MNAVRTAERLKSSRFDLGVVCLRNQGPLAERYAAAGIPLFHFPISSLYGAGTVRQGIRLARFLRERRVDVFHAHDRYSNIFGAPWARLAGVPTVIASRRWWQAEVRAGHRAANRFAYRFAHAVLANSPSVAELLVDTENVRRRRVAVVPNFVDECAFVPPGAELRRNLLAELEVPQDRPTIGIVANLRPIKDHQNLLRAVALLRPKWPDLHVVLVGEGECRSALDSRAVELGIRDQIHFAGSRPNDPNPHYLFQISVLCSLSEGLPNSLLEAMAAGNPVVATDVGATADAVIDGETGILVPASDPAALAMGIDRLLGSPQLARAMGVAGRRRVQESFSAQSAIEALVSLYTRTAASA